MAYVVIYWVSTALLTFVYFSSALLYITKRDVARQGQAGLGYNAENLIDFMIVIKIVGPLVILTRFNIGLSDLAYAGIFYHLVLSLLAHLGVRQPKGGIPAMVSLVFLFGSFLTQNAARIVQSPYAPHFGL